MSGRRRPQRAGRLVGQRWRTVRVGSRRFLRTLRGEQGDAPEHAPQHHGGHTPHLGRFELDSLHHCLCILLDQFSQTRQRKRSGDSSSSSATVLAQRRHVNRQRHAPAEAQQLSPRVRDAAGSSPGRGRRAICGKPRAAFRKPTRGKMGRGLLSVASTRVRVRRRFDCLGAGATTRSVLALNVRRKRRLRLTPPVAPTRQNRVGPSGTPPSRMPVEQPCP